MSKASVTATIIHLNDEGSGSSLYTVTFFNKDDDYIMPTHFFPSYEDARKCVISELGDDAVYKTIDTDTEMWKYTKHDTKGV